VSAAPPLQADGLFGLLGDRRVVDDCSLALQAGQWVALVGPNGAGKSTLLQLLAGLREPVAGRVLLQGRALAAWPPRERAAQLAWLAQQADTDTELPARSLVELGRLPRHGLLGAPDAADGAAVARALADTATTALGARRLSQLSGGERQRVLVARALAVEAPVLLLDEPVAHLDAPHQVALLRTLRQRARDGAAVLAVLHDLNLALAADRVLVMDRGRLVADGPPGDAALHATLAAVFEHAVTVQPAPDGRRWMAVPTV
jgi:iron complex transport system ATP-binding protein